MEMQNKKLCLHCKQMVDVGAKFCPYCGGSEFQGSDPNAAQGQNQNGQQFNNGYAQQPGGYQQPNGGYQQPTGGYQQPNGGYQQPNGGYQQPNGGYQQPNGGYQQPNGGYQQPNGGYQQPNGGYQQQPNGGYQQQPYGYAAPGQNTGFSAPQTNKPLKWFKFLIYFSLFAGAVVNIIFGFTYITGGIYEVQTDGEVTSELIYAIFKGVKAVDVLYGIFMIAVGALQIYTRFRLAKFKANGPLMLYITYGVSLVLSLLYAALISSITHLNAFDSSTISSIISNIVLIALNYVYFNKRKELFVN